MKIITAFIVLLLATSPVSAQRLSGRVQNDEDGVILQGVVVRNLTHPSMATSDATGHYTVAAYKGDTLLFTLLGYAARELVFTGMNETWFENVMLKPQSMVLDSVVIHKELTPYQKDSLERREIYGRSADYRPAKTRYNPAKNPFVVESPISGLIEKHSKRYKKLKQFQEMYASDEKASFITSRYDPALVSTLTGLHHEDLYRFMQAYPMTYEYARAATDLEIKMWIRYNFKEWSRNAIVPPSGTTGSGKP